jgi:endo-1,4-beta-xylanase
MLRYWLASAGLSPTTPRRLRPVRVAAVIPSILGLSLSACGGGSERPEKGAPVIVEAERGNTGSGVQVVVDAADSSITYVTAAVNVTDPPADATDPRVVSAEVKFPEAGQYQIYARVRIGPEGGNDDSFFIDTGTATPTWTVANGLSGFPVQGQAGYQEGAVIGQFGGQSTPGRWMWALLDPIAYTVAEGALSRTVSFATREDGLDIDKFAFALVGDGVTTGFTTDQLDAGKPGVSVVPPIIPDPYSPPADQLPFAVDASKWLGMVCCGNQRPFLENYFNQITPENAGKWGSVEATRGVYNWAPLDEALGVAQANGFPFRYHVLLWGDQQPAWIATLPPDEQLTAISQWMAAVAERYGEAATYIEVVNEFENTPPTAANEGNYIDALGGTGASGFDWVLNAFRMARAAFPPNAKLMLNEYSVINNDDRTGRYVQLVELLKAEGLINLIGFQGHAFSTRGSTDQMRANIERLAATGLPILVTEMDVDGPPPVQLADFQRIFPVFWENEHIEGITLWGYRDGHWRQAQQATLVYSNGAEKPALRWLKGYVRGTLPVVSGPATASVTSGYAKGTEVGTFVASTPGGAAYPEGTPVAWGVVPAPAGQPDASQAIAFDEGTGRLHLEGAKLSPGTYSIRVYADVDMTVSNLFEIQLTVQ